MIKSIIGCNIRLLRENADFTQSSVAQFLDIGQSLISKVEKGERSLSSDKLEKLSALFGVTPEQLESGPVERSSLSFAFRGSELSASEMETIAAINRIALCSNQLSILLAEDNR